MRMSEPRPGSPSLHSGRSRTALESDKRREWKECGAAAGSACATPSPAERGGRGYDSNQLWISIEKSICGAEWVSAPTLIQSTPVSA